MKYSELVKLMRNFNDQHEIERAVDTKKNAAGERIEMTGYVVIKEDRLNPKYGPYPRERRIYKFSNYEKALTPGDGGYSIFAYNEADDDCMRIEGYSDSDIEEAGILEKVE